MAASVSEFADWASIGGGVFSFMSVIFAIYVTKTVKRIRRDVYRRQRVPLLLRDLETSSSSFSHILSDDSEWLTDVYKKIPETRVYLETLLKASGIRDTRKQLKKTLALLKNFNKQLKETTHISFAKKTSPLENLRITLYEELLVSIQKVKIDIDDRQEEVFP